MSHQGKPSTSTTSDAAQFVSRGGKGGRGRGGGGGRGQSSNKQQQQKTRQNTPGGGSGAQQGNKATRPPAGAAPAGTPAAAQNGASERKDGAAAAPKQTQSYVPKAAPATAVPPSAAAPPAGVQQLPVPTAATSAQQPTHQQAAAPAADGNGTTGAAALQAPAPHAPQPRPPVTATGGQGPAPPYVGYTNGAGAPPPGGRGRGIPPRTQSAPPNLKEQKQSPIFIPTRATPNAGAFPAAPYYPPSGPYYPPPPGVQPGVSPSHPYAPPGQGVPPPRGGPNLYQPPAHGRAQGPPGAGAHGVGPQGGPPPSMGGPLPQGVGAPQMPPQQPMGPTTYVPPHRIPTFVPGRAAPFIPRGHAGLQPIPPPHSMPMQIPQKRRTNRIAIIDPKTGKEVGNSPPKDESPLNDTASPYQQSPPGAGLRIPHGGGGIMSHPYAPAGTSPSRQAPHFKPDDFADGGPVEQFAPNHPYAPGRSAAIPIEKPPSAAVVISKPPAPAETASSATTPSPTTTATTPTEQPSGSAPQEAAQEAAAAPATTEAASAQEPTTKPAEADKKETEVPPPEKQAPEEQQKQEEEPPKQPEESKAETPAPQAAEAQPKPEPTVEERKPEEVKAEETAPEAAKQLEEAKQVEQVPAVDATKDESSEKAPEAQPTEPAAAPEPTPAPATEKPTDEAEPGKAEHKPATEESGKKASESRAGKAKPTRKGSVKKSDEGDAKPSEATEKKASEDADKKPTEEPHKPKEEEQPPAKPAEAEQDDDDWEVKAEKEDLVLQKDISLRPSYTGSSGAQAPFRSTLTPQAGDASWSGSGSKRTYDRDFLLKFQTFCRERPDGLPPVEVILGNDDRGKSGGGAGGGARGGKGGRGGGMNSSGEWSRGQQQFANRGRGGPGMFAPAPAPGKFNAPPGLSAPMARGPGAAARGAPQGGPMRRVPKKGMPGREAPPGIMPPPEPVAPMVDNPSVWKPSRRRGDDNEEIYGKVRSILNKLTSDKFGPLSAQMVELLKSKATTVEILREIINIIFDKALAEPGFSTMYAELCRVLEKNCPTFETNKEGKPQTFKRILLNRCQEAFEHKPQEEQPTEDPLKKEEIEVKQKRRMIGNIVFIGELYKEHMLTDKIMHECVFRRLLGEMKNPAEADLEALCKLMNTIGKVLDVPKAKNYMEAYFKRMKTLSQNPNIPSRIRFLLLDVLDLRANKWVSSVTEKPKQGGRGGAQPKSAGPSAPAAAGGPGGRGGGGSGAYRPGGAGSGPQGGRANQDGWETVGRGGHSRGDRSERGGDRGGSSGSERGPPVTLSSGEVVLGPNQSRMGTMMGGTGAKGWRDASNKARPQDSRRDAASSRPGAAPAPAPKGNIFAALSDMPERSPQAESRQSARPTSVRDRSRSREDREAPAPSPRSDARKEAAAPSPRSAEKEAEVGPLDPEIEKSIKLLLEEFLDTQDEEEARQCVDDIEGSGFQPHLVKAIIVMATEKKEEVREMLLQLITHFHKKATITPAHFTAGLRLVLEQLDDIRLDAPMAPKVVGQFIGSALLDEYLSASFVLPALEPLVESGSALSVLVGLFNFYVENTSIGDTREFVKEAGWDVNSMFKKSKRDPASVTDWIQVNGLDRVFPVAWAQGRLKALLESGDDAGKILKWMEENVARDVWDDEEFVQRLTGVFVEFVGARTKALSDAQAVAEEETKLFEQYAPFLKQFTADSPQTQQACLAAVQRYCFGLNFPDGLLERLFQNLLDNELVDDEAFSTWAADTQDSFGKSQALAQVSGWLSGAQKEDDGEGAP